MATYLLGNGNHLHSLTSAKRSISNMNSEKKTFRARKSLIATVATLALTGAVGLGAISTGVAPVLADPVKLSQPVEAPSFADVVELVSPAVVSVRVSSVAPEAAAAGSPFPGMPGFEDLPPDHPLRRFFDQFRGEGQQGQGPRGMRPRERGPQKPRPSAQGSGFFISEDGYIVTNNHVVEGGSEYTVVMSDGTELQADLVGTDPRTDLAVLKAQSSKKFTYVDFADESKMRVGDWVVAVGNPFGLGGTVTAGIISARGRDIGASFYDDFIQIDAAVNRGNSGGPTFNLAGEVVGVNTAIFSPSGGNVGIAFAIPAALVKNVVDDLIKDGAVERGWLGVQIADVSKEIAESVGLADAKGALINDVNSGEAAEKGGIKAGDIIISVNGDDVASSRDLARKIGNQKPNADVEVVVWRNGKTETLSVKLGKMPGAEQTAKASTKDQAPEATETNFGLSVTPADDGNGLLVTDVKPDSDAESSGILPGDIIRSVNSKPISSAKDMKAAADEARKAGRNRIFVQIVRDNANRFITLPIS